MAPHQVSRRAGGLRYGNKGRDVALWRRVNSADLPAHMKVKLLEFLKMAGGGKQWKNDFCSH